MKLKKIKTIKEAEQIFEKNGCLYTEAYDSNVERFVWYFADMLSKTDLFDGKVLTTRGNMIQIKHKGNVFNLNITRA